MADQFAPADARPEIVADVATFRAEHISGWQSEVAAFLGECFEEVQAVSAMLQSLEGRVAAEPATSSPVTGPWPESEPVPPIPTSPKPIEPAFEPTASPDSVAAPATPAPIAPITASEPEPAVEASDDDFDERLANLKKLLAKKLSDSES